MCVPNGVCRRQHGPRLYVVMEAAGGGDLCSHVLGARGAARGLPEARARSLAAQLVSAVRHMHARGVVHRYHTSQYKRYIFTLTTLITIILVERCPLLDIGSP